MDQRIKDTTYCSMCELKNYKECQFNWLRDQFKENCTDEEKFFLRKEVAKVYTSLFEARHFDTYHTVRDAHPEERRRLAIKKVQMN